MKYIKIFTDEGGDTHFEDVEIDVKSVVAVPSTPPINLSTYFQASRYAFCIFPSGWCGDWHPAPQKQILFQLSGECEIQVSDGEVRRFNAGGVLLVEDTWGKGHLSRVLGSEDMVAVVVQLPE